MAVIRVPKTPARAFNKRRRPSELLLKQIEHLLWASLPASKRKPRQLKRRRIKVRTEGGAANEIERLTKLVLAQKDRPYAPPAEPAHSRRARKGRRISKSGRIGKK